MKMLYNIDTWLDHILFTVDSRIYFLPKTPLSLARTVAISSYKAESLMPRTNLSY